MESSLEKKLIKGNFGKSNIFFGGSHQRIFEFGKEEQIWYLGSSFNNCLYLGMK